ncbi:MAG: IS110 family transposase [Labilithrix sp.]|nr:IS110 family transposase [Labilithrix sp.]
MARSQLSRLEEVDTHITKLDGRIDSKLAPYREHHVRLAQIPGVDRVLAAVMIAELGTDMTVFKSAGHLAAWAVVCPGNNESAGKKKKGTARKGNVHLMTALVEAAHGASRKKDSYFKDKFFRLKARRGYLLPASGGRYRPQDLKAVYVMLSTGVDYRELGASYLDAVDARRVTGNLVRRLERLGYDVKIAPRLPEGSPIPPAAMG